MMASIRKTAGPGSPTAPARTNTGTVASPALRSRAAARRNIAASAAADQNNTFARDLSSTPRLVQHKNEAKLFYQFLSIVYDDIVNPLHWSVDQREVALAPADLRAGQKVCDVGGGTGFTTIGIVKNGVDPKDITLLDQSPHQLAKAAAKPLLKGVTIIEGDAEALPFETDSYDRYVSAGSIEYWPEPQRGICEAYRVLKPGGVACMIGPVHPTHPVSRFFADAWMLFPKEEEYLEWFTKAGFTDVQLHRFGPKWYRGVRRHGLIMGCSVVATKPKSGASPLVLPPAPQESSSRDNSNPVSKLVRLILGTAAGFYYFCLPIYMYIKNMITPEGKPL
jgi:MPBQ/MSBQ methyltransferase